MFFVVLQLILQQPEALMKQVSGQHTRMLYMETQTWPLLLKVHGWSPSQPCFRFRRLHASTPPFLRQKKTKQNEQPNDYSVVVHVSKLASGSFLLFEQKVGYIYEAPLGVIGMQDISVNNYRDTGYLLQQLTGYVVLKEPLFVSNEHEESSSRISDVRTRKTKTGN